MIFVDAVLEKINLLGCLILFSVQSRSTMLEYGSSVATRGLIHSNTARAQAAHQSSVGFKPLHKPHWLHISKTVMRNYAELVVRSLTDAKCIIILTGLFLFSG